MSNSKLINGFSDYKTLSNFFQNLAQEMRDNGECNLGGNALLERFCKADGTSDRRTIKGMYDKIENPFMGVKSISDLEKVLGDFQGEFLGNSEGKDKTDDFFGNKSHNHFSILNDPNYEEDHKCFYAETPIGHILFGEIAKAPYFSKHLNTGNSKYFVTIDGNPMVGEECELMDNMTLISSNFEKCVNHVKKLVNQFMNPSYLDVIDDDSFFTEIINDFRITECITSHWQNTNGLDWIDSEIIKIIKSIFSFDRKIDPKLMGRIIEHFNQHVGFNIVSYDGETAYENNLGENINDEEYAFYKDAISDITMSEIKGSDDYIFVIESSDKKKEITVTIDNIKELKESQYI